MTIPFFDGHNDTLLKLIEDGGSDPVAAFINGMPGAHIDLPRAKAAGMAGGFFALFPPAPKQPLSAAVASASGGDQAGLPPDLPFHDAMPPTLAMAALMFRLERAGALAVCRTVAEIDAAVGAGKLAAIFHIEGAEAIDSDFRSLEVLHAAGLRSIGPVWSRANVFGTGVPFRHNADPDIGPGLTPLGKELVRQCNRLGIMLDVSHLNAAGFRDLAALSDKPIVATHSNVHGISPHARNLTDWQLSAIAESRGVVGLNFATGFLRPDGQMRADTDIELMVRHIDALIQKLGEDGVALGSDFDGATVPAPIGDVSGVPKLLQALLEKGFGEPLVRKVAMGNWMSLLSRTWH